MKNIVSLFLLTYSLQAFEYNLVPQKLSEDIYCFFGKPENISKENGGNMVNTCFVQTKEGFVVIDSGPTYGYASQAFVQMQEIAPLPVKYVINTHDHDDHWLGNSFYKEQGALLIGPETYEQNVVPGMKTRMERELGEAIFDKTKIVTLDTIVKSTYRFTLGAKIFEVLKVSDRAHTSGDLIVHLAKESVVFAGDLVFNDRLTSMRDGSIVGAIAALDAIDAMKANIIVGGHGYRTDNNATVLLRAYLEEMNTEIRTALDADVSLNEITQKVTMPKYKKLKLYDMLHKRNVLDSYSELEFVTNEEDE